MSRASGYFVFLAVYFIFAVIRGLSRPQKKSGGKASSSDGPTSVVTRTAAPAARARKADRDFGDVNHQYSHVNDKRVEQVNAYLKAGLIDKTEYRQMLERYTKEDQQFTDY